MTKSIMIQGAGSNVGKSLIVAGLARAFNRRGLSVAPFKPQNMSNNAAVTVDGGEIGRAQAMQAMAAGIDPVVDMNPVLLKPETDTGAVVVLQGQVLQTVKARDYVKMKPTLLPKVLESYNRLCAKHDMVIVEGAGSPAETNLRHGDIANMGFAEAANVPVVLVGDIDRGGVIAQLAGTHLVLSDVDKSLIKAFLVNKFRGDPTLFDEGVRSIEKFTGWSAAGVIPWFADAWKLPAEDVMDITNRKGGAIKIAVPRLGRIANFDDLDPLSCEPSVKIEIIEPGRPLPGDAALVLIPGSKSTISDLAEFRKNGWDVDLKAHIRRGGRVLGICGGYQMLGATIVDPQGLEGRKGTYEGLGHLAVTTTMEPEKRLANVSGTHIASGHAVSGYEIHIGQTDGPDCSNPWLEVSGKPHGATSADGLIQGAYLHGIFSADGFRDEFLRGLGAVGETANYGATVDATLNALADHIETHVDMDQIEAISEAKS